MRETSDYEEPRSALVPWRITETGQEWLTIVVNVSFDLRSERVARIVPARPVDARDSAPCKPHAEAVVLGHARTGGSARLLGVGVARGPRILLQKRLVSLGKGGDDAGGGLFDAAELATQGARGRGFRAAVPTALPRDGDGVLQVATDLDLSRQQRCDSDQWLPDLVGGERIRMTGFEGGDVDVRLPQLMPRATLDRVPISLACDTLELDADRGVATLTFRGSIRRRDNVARSLAVTLLPSVDDAADFSSPRAWAAPRRLAPSPAVDVVEVHDRTGFPSWTMRWSPAQGDLRRVLIVKGSFDLESGEERPPRAPEQAPFEPERIATSADDHTHPSDFAPFKPETDIIVRARAHGCGKPLVPVRLEVGELAVELVAMGPRRFEAQGIPGAPAALDSLPLTWGHAFGGPEISANPSGTGAALGSTPPRIEAPTALMRAFGDRPVPVGLSAVPSDAPLRSRLLGSFDDAWERDRWPHAPADFDPRYHQAAPPGLRLASAPEGAPVRITNVRPDGAPVAFSLPDVRPHAALFRAHHEPERVSLRLDTISIDVEQGRLFLVWRGSYAIATRQRPSERIVIVPERVTEPLSSDAIAALLAGARDPSWEDAVAGSFRAGPVTIAELVARFAPPRTSDRAALEPRASISSGEVAALLAAGKSLRGKDLTRSNLAGADLRSADLRGAILRGAKLMGARLDGADLEGAVLSQVDARDAHFDGANLRRADFALAELSQASFRGVRLERASFARASLGRSVLDGATGEGASFVGARMEEVSVGDACMPRADFTDAKLARSSFLKADLGDATFQESDVTSARFDEARLENARFELATAVGASFERARADGSTWDGADLSGASFASADLAGTVFGATLLASANLAGVRAENALFREADLSGGNLAGAHLKGACFEWACLERASLERANLDEAELTMASLTGAKLEGAFMETTVPRRTAQR